MWNVRPEATARHAGREATGMTTAAEAKEATEAKEVLKDHAATGKIPKHFKNI